MIFVCNKFELTLYLLLLLWHYYSYCYWCWCCSFFRCVYRILWSFCDLFFCLMCFFFVQHLSLSKLVFCFYPNYLLVLFIHIFLIHVIKIHHWNFVCFIFELFCLLHCLWTHTHQWQILCKQNKITFQKKNCFMFCFLYILNGFWEYTIFQTNTHTHT